MGLFRDLFKKSKPPTGQAGRPDAGIEEARKGLEELSLPPSGSETPAEDDVAAPTASLAAAQEAAAQLGMSHPALGAVDYTHDEEEHHFAGNLVPDGVDGEPQVQPEHGAFGEGGLRENAALAEQGTAAHDVSGGDFAVAGEGQSGAAGLAAPGGAPADGPAPLTSMVYLTEDGENVDDSMSVVSDVRTEEELAGELTELSRALEALEEEAVLAAASPTAASAGAGRGSWSWGATGGGAAAAAAAAVAALGASADDVSVGGTSFTSGGGTTAAAFANNMVKLYNDLAVRLMDAKDYDQALSMLRKAEGLLDNDPAWSSTEGVPGGGGGADGVRGSSVDEVSSGGAPFGSAAEVLAAKRQRLMAITFNNIGCLHKRRALPQQALTYLQRALALEEAGGQMHNCASTHLNICAALSALDQYREALAHAERAILLLQRQLWGPAAASFQEGMAYLTRTLGALSTAAAAGGASADPGAAGSSASAALAHAEAQRQHRRYRQLLAGVNVLAMAYHNAAVEHERMGHMREAEVSYSRACAIGAKFLGPKSATATALAKAQRAFVSRHQRSGPPSSSVSASRKGPGAASSSAKAHVRPIVSKKAASAAAGPSGRPKERNKAAAGGLLYMVGGAAKLPIPKAGAKK